MHDIQKQVAISLTNCCFKKKVLIFKLDESLYVDRAPTLWSKGHGFESSRGNNDLFFVPHSWRYHFFHMLASLVCLLGSWLMCSAAMHISWNTRKGLGSFFARENKFTPRKFFTPIRPLFNRFVHQHGRHNVPITRTNVDFPWISFLHLL